MGDIDGDGFSDVVTTQKFWVGLGGNSYNPQNYTNVMKNSEAGALNQVVTDGDLDPNEFLGDFNGDGRTDLFDQNSTSTAALFSNGDGTFTSDGGDSSLATGTLVPADFDGDGCTDMLAQGASNLIHYFCSPATTSVSVTNFTGSTIVLGDFNGDGKSDLLVIGASAATIYLSTGTGFTSGHTVTSSSSWHNYKVMAGDWDGDGRADVVLLSQASGTAHTVFLSTGTDFTQVTTISNSDTSVSAVVADWNNDGGQDFWMKKSSGDMLYTFAFVPEAMTSISNGIGATTTITYDRLNKNGSLYAKGTATYPQIALDGPVYVVSQVSASNGIGGSYTQTFAYSGAFGRFATTTYAQAVGGHTNSAYSGITSASTAAALFGFAQVVMTDSQTTIVQTTNYRTDFPYVGRVSSQTSVLSGVTLRSVSNTWAASNLGGTRNFVSLSESVVSGHDANGATLPTTTTDYTYDSYGNALTITASVSDGSSSTTTNTFTNDTTHWILGELATASVDNVVGSSNITRSASFAHDSTSGLLTQTIVEPSNCEYKLQTDYTLDGFGNRTAAQVSGAGCSSDSYRTAITTRTNDAGYDTAGEFQTSTTNALSQADSTAFSASFGAPTSHTDLNSHTTSWSYDSFGRMTLETRPDSTKTAISFAFCSGVNGGSASCPTYGAYLKQTEAFASNGTTQIGPIVTVYFDALNRVIAQDMQAYDGSVSRTATVYDSYGRVSETSRPYFVAINSPNYTVNTYDALGRVTRQDFPNSSGYYTMSYNGLTVSKTNDHSQTTSTTLNAQGQPASVVDAASHTTSYVYDAFGRLLTVTDPSSNTITNAYDLRGNKTDSYDPDMGHWTYVSDVLGELKSQVDAKSQTTTLTYDLLGRPTERGESGLVSDWVYDGATYGVGLPQKACTSASSNSTCTSATTTRVFTYDSTSRPSTTAITVDSTTYTYTTTYNTTNQAIDTVTSPSGLVTKDFYNSYGYLCRITDNGGSHSCTSTSDSHVLWTAGSGDAELHLLTQTAGNAAFSTAQTFDANTGQLLTVGAGTSSAVAQFTYTYDTLGNLSSRVDSDSSVYEKFCYDSLNRLTNSATASSAPTACTSTGGGITSKTIAYDSLGNITSKDDVGTYAYPSSGGGTGSRPHAVSSIAGTVNGVTNPSYTYDANGNMTAGAGRSVSYTPFNMADTLTQGSTTVAFDYDSGHQRIKQCIGSSCATSTTYYLNDPASGAMSEKFVAGGSTVWHDFLKANGGLVGERFYTVGGSTVWKYFVADHLGSAAVVTDSSGTVSERLSYDAWGRRRNSNGTDNSACSITSATTRGYTGHEMMDGICEINANARIYDPTIGRFMSADTMIPNAFNGQSFNRFSYVGNNPLSGTDPSGHDNFCANGTASGNTNGSGCPPVYDDGYGPPPWGDEGPGMTERADGSFTSAESQGFGSVDVPGLGTVTGRQDELRAYRAQMNAVGSTPLGAAAAAIGDASTLANGIVTSAANIAANSTNITGDCATTIEIVVVNGLSVPLSDRIIDGMVIGPDGSFLTGTQIGNIAFNELRSLSGDGLAAALGNVAHAIINGQLVKGNNRPKTASTTANPGPGESPLYQEAQSAANLALIESQLDVDPTAGAIYFNLRNSDNMANFEDRPVTTQTGPFDNSFPTTGPTGLNGGGVYVNTYGHDRHG